MYEGAGIIPDFEVYNEGEPYPSGTFEELDANTPLYRGRVSGSILAMQQRLRALGLLPIEPNGYFGDITLWSLNVFQKAKGLEITSYATAETLKALEVEAGETKIYEDKQMEFALNRLKGAAAD
jgi:peptidoglycan hydrolase-like protein with peptidoglycan-binding domain